MDKQYEKKHHALEKTHWWFIARCDIIKRLLKASNKNLKILDLGCGGGSLLLSLQKQGFSNIHGIDLSENAIKLCKSSGLPNVSLMNGEQMKFKDNSFDFIIVSDVLEHIKDDKAALSESFRILKSSGKIIVFVPAFDFLWSGHDDVNLHYRRYSAQTLNNKLESAGFQISRTSYWNFFLFIPAFLLKFLQKFSKKTTDQLYESNPLVNFLLIKLLFFENFLLEYINFPFGVSVFSIAEKSHKRNAS
ncbi:class I SAM-dependent methyltransferase [Candidatus Micrarchaeota archaeon]|nr:class I SAM-dependent methyltransferase [Candidatus Micrarchaeota archaeon]MBU1681474.1 class I SAM-dependent methyltransferase [Candidatus Micrarchaeota archaeon]